MKVLVVGASGTVGQAVVDELGDDAEVVTASLTKGEYQVDMGDTESIKQLFGKLGKLDAVVCTAARGVTFKPIAQMSVEDYSTSMQQKLFGQINLVLLGLNALNDGGSFTLTTGIMNHDFVKNGSAAAMVNNAVEGFAQAAALDMPRGIRINVVSPALLEASVEKYKEFCPGFEPVSSQKVARAFRKSIYGIQTGRVYRVQ